MLSNPYAVCPHVGSLHVLGAFESLSKKHVCFKRINGLRGRFIIHKNSDEIYEYVHIFASWGARAFSTKIYRSFNTQLLCVYLRYPKTRAEMCRNKHIPYVYKAVSGHQGKYTEFTILYGREICTEGSCWPKICLWYRGRNSVHRRSQGRPYFEPVTRVIFFVYFVKCFHWIHF